MSDEFQNYCYECVRMGEHLSKVASRILANKCQPAMRAYIEDYNLTEIRFIDPDLGQAHLDSLFALVTPERKHV